MGMSISDQRIRLLIIIISSFIHSKIEEIHTSNDLLMMVGIDENMSLILQQNSMSSRPTSDLSSHDPNY